MAQLKNKNKKKLDQQGLECPHKAEALKLESPGEFIRNAGSCCPSTQDPEFSVSRRVPKNLYFEQIAQEVQKASGFDSHWCEKGNFNHFPTHLSLSASWEVAG